MGDSLYHKELFDTFLTAYSLHVNVIMLHVDTIILNVDLFDGKNKFLQRTEVCQQNYDAC